MSLLMGRCASLFVLGAFLLHYYVHVILVPSGILVLVMAAFSRKRELSVGEDGPPDASECFIANMYNNCVKYVLERDLSEGVAADSVLDEEDVDYEPSVGKCWQVQSECS